MAKAQNGCFCPSDRWFCGPTDKPRHPATLLVRLQTQHPDGVVGTAQLPVHAERSTVEPRYAAEWRNEIGMVLDMELI